MEECLSSEHSSELFTDSLEHFLDGSWVSEESDGHFKSLWWDITDWWFDVVWDPFNEIRGVLVLNIQHLLIDFFGWHSSSKEGWSGKISTVSWIWSAHHVFSIKHLLGELWDGKGSILLRSSWGQWSESSHEEMETGEGDQVYSQFSQIRVQLTWESEAASNAWNGSWDQVVKITIGWSGKLKGSETDIIKSFVIDAHDFIGIFYQLMDWKSGIIWFNDGIWDFWWWYNWEGAHDSIWIFFSDLWDKKSSHSWSSSSSEWVSDLETLEAIATFSFFSHDVQDWIDQFSTFGIVTLGPVVTGTWLTEDEVVWSEELSEWASSDWVHGSWFKIHKDCSWDVSASSSFIVINIDSFKLKIWITVIGSSGVNTVLIWDDFPEFSSNLVSALSSLDVYNFSH